MENPKFLPEDINAEVLMQYLPMGTYRLKMGSVHNRNAYYDIQSLEEDPITHDQTLVLGRNSLYEMLPEMMFHPIDRFDGIPDKDKEERFPEELEKQAEEIARAKQFFAPYDAWLMRLRVDVRNIVEERTAANQVLVDILCDNMPEEWHSNRFIQRLMEFVPHAKRIRGDLLLISLMLRKVLLQEGLQVKVQAETLLFEDQQPRYPDSMGDELGACFAGNRYEEEVPVLRVLFWVQEECGPDFLTFIDEVEEMRRFVQDYFISIEQFLAFDIHTDAAPLRLADTEIYNYLNYNTNL